MSETQSEDCIIGDLFLPCEFTQFYVFLLQLWTLHWAEEEGGINSVEGKQASRIF